MNGLGSLAKSARTRESPAMRSCGLLDRTGIWRAGREAGDHDASFHAGVPARAPPSLLPRPRRTGNMGGIVKRVTTAVLLLATLGVAACGGDQPEPAVEVPPWAKVAPEQIAEAKKLGVRVAFENKVGMRFVLIPAGTFVMGAPRSEWKYYAHTEKLHRVRLTSAVYMQTTELTNAQYRRLNPDHSSGELFGRSLDADDQPVQGLSWDDASEFALWLSREDASHEYDVPTEAQWEYACRAGTTTAFSFGERVSPGLVNSRYGGPRPSRPRPFEDPEAVRSPVESAWSVPVGSLPPNPWGLHEMHGNVEEWCQDWYAEEYPAGLSIDPSGPPTGGHFFTLDPAPCRAVRGGHHGVGVSRCRAASRQGIPHDSRGGRIGLRLVSPLPGKQDAE